MSHHNDGIVLETTEMYRNVCKDRFDSQNNDMAEIRRDTQYLRAKIDNGLSSVPSQVTRMQTQYRNTFFYGILPVLLLMVGGSGIWLYNLGKLEEKLNASIENTQQSLEMVVKKLENVHPEVFLENSKKDKSQ